MATIASMTGFSRASGVSGAVQWALELKSVNGRGLDVRVRVPAGREDVGEAARQTIQAALTRGQCQLSLTLARAETAPRMRLNAALLASLAEALVRVPVPAGLAPPSLDALLSVRGVIEAEDGSADDEGLAPALMAALGPLVADLAAARQAEGRALAEVLGAQVDAIAHHVAAAQDCPARGPDAVRARLAAQVAALMETGSSLDPDRLHQEAVLLAAKADVREEIDRLAAHVAAARALLAAGGAVGRRLDFLAQEFGREANTLCAKANDVALSRIGLDLKVVVEQFREQVQNVE